jgi:autoinducer 2 (AI-2) kinase
VLVHCTDRSRRNLSSEYVAAIDAGTGSGRCVIFDSEGNQIAIASREWSHPTIPEFPGSFVFETRENWRLLCESIRDSIQRAKIRPEEIRGVSATSMREGMVLYDGAGQEIWACPNVDSRATNEVTQLIKKGFAEKIYPIAGDWLSITSPSRFLWIKKRQPEIYKKAEHMTMISDWILYKLSGKFVTDPSIGSSSNLFQLSKRTWSDDIIDMLRLRREIFPEVKEPGAVLGEVTVQGAAETGFNVGTPVIVGGADTQLGLIGIGAVEPYRTTTIGGTFWQQTIVTERPVIDPETRLRTLCHAVPNHWMTEGIGFLCGLTMRWFRDAFCEWEKEIAAKEEVDTYYLLEKQAESVPPGSNGVIPIFSDIMNAKRWLHASPSFIQFDMNRPQSSGRKECFRAIEESAAYVALGHLKIIESITRRRAKEVVFCGGASKGFLWPQILADVLGVKVNVPLVKESTALGAAICAGVGVGVFPNLQEAAQKLVKWERAFEPNKNNHSEYVKLYKQWRKVYERSLDMVEDSLVKPMWRAAGT